MHERDEAPSHRLINESFVCRAYLESAKFAITSRIEHDIAKFHLIGLTGAFSDGGSTRNGWDRHKTVDPSTGAHQSKG